MRNTFLLVIVTKQHFASLLNSWNGFAEFPQGCSSKGSNSLDSQVRLHAVLGVMCPVLCRCVARYEDGTEFLPMESDVCDEESEAYVTNLSYYHLVPFETDILEWGFYRQQTMDLWCWHWGIHSLKWIRAMQCCTWLLQLMLLQVLSPISESGRCPTCTDTSR